jgi:hypothetical protein
MRSPAGWLIGCLLFWIGVFPLYLFSRRKTPRKPATGADTSSVALSEQRISFEQRIDGLDGSRSALRDQASRRFQLVAGTEGMGVGAACAPWSCRADRPRRARFNPWTIRRDGSQPWPPGASPALEHRDYEDSGTTEPCLRQRLDRHRWRNPSRRNYRPGRTLEQASLETPHVDQGAQRTVPLRRQSRPPRRSRSSHHATRRPNRPRRLPRCAAHRSKQPEPTSFYLGARLRERPCRLKCLGREPALLDEPAR